MGSLGSVDVVKNEVEVGLEKFEKSHPIAINFYTKRYGGNPLII